MSAASSSQPRRRSAAASVSLLSIVVIAMLVISSPAEAERNGHITFAGLKAATTCIPGPIWRRKNLQLPPELGTGYREEQAFADRLRGLPGDHPRR
jgi:hypothetical protein